MQPFPRNVSGLKPNCDCRIARAVLTVPNKLDEKVVFGLDRFTMLNALVVSARNCGFTDSRP